MEKLDEVKELADRNGHVMVVICRWISFLNKKDKEVTIPKYKSFQTYDEFLLWYNMLRKPSIGVCEVTWQNQPMKAYVDMDEKCENEVIKHQPILDAVEKIKQRAVALGLRSHDWEPVYVVAIGSRYLADESFKYSVHIVFLNLSFANRAQLCCFMQPICEEMKIIDQSVYRSGKSQAFRFPGSVKWDDSSRVPLKPHPRWSTQQPSEADFIISNPDLESIVTFDLPSQTQKRKLPSNHQTTKKQRVGTISDDAVVKDIKYYLTSSQVELKNGSYYVKKGRCPIAGRVHGSNNGYCRKLNNNNVYYWCFNEKCKKKGKYLLF
jgi:hypothetical protein